MGASYRIPWARPSIGDDEIAEVVAALRSGWVSAGPRVAALEQRLAALTRRAHAVAVSSGTAALDVALKALGVGPGHEVIVPALAYIAVPNAVSYQGARLVLADIDARTWNIDPGDVDRRITPRTRAIIALDYGGAPADYPALAELARERGVALVADGAESLGAQLHGQPAAGWGDIAIASFHTAKVLTTVEGGMLFTNDPELAGRARVLRSQGEDPSQKYRHVLVGHNYRMSDLHAAVGLAQLARLPALLAERQRLADRYDALLSDLKLPRPLPLSGSTPAWFLYSLLAPGRDAVQRRLAERGIEARASWPLPVHQQPCYAPLFPGQRYPVAEQVAASVLSLPLYPGLGDDEQREVVDALRRAL